MVISGTDEGRYSSSTLVTWAISLTALTANSQTKTSVKSPTHTTLGEGGRDEYEDTPGFCKSATLDEVRSHDHILTPGRYVGAKAQKDDGEPFEEKMAHLAAEWWGAAGRIHKAGHGDCPKLGESRIR